MPDQLQLRGGTTTEHNSFTGALREVTVDTTKKTLVVHDGASAGGTALMKESGSNAASTVGIGVGGANKITINADGHVDIASNLDCAAGLDVTGAITCTGGLTVDTNTLFVNGSNNRVGIGTASPDTTLSVSGTGDGVVNIDTSDSRGAFVRFGQGGSFHNMVGCADGLTSGDKEDLGVRAADNIIFAAGGSSEKMRIDSSGNVGIGTTSPNDKLDVNGGIVCSPNTDGKDTFQLSTHNANEGRLRIKNVDTTTVQIRAGGDSYFNGGNVGIGTTSPLTDAQLTLSHADSPALAFQRSGSGRFETAIAIESGHFFFKAGADSSTVAGLSDVMKIESTGNVGIGTTSPVAKFHVHNAGTGSGDHAYAYFTTGDTGATASDGLTIGIAATQVASISYREAGPLAFGTSSTERMRIDSSGRVLVGTTSAVGGGAPLQVVDASDSGIYLGNSNTNASGIVEIEFAPSNNVTTSIIRGYAIEDASQASEMTGGLGFFIREDANFKEAVRIDREGNVLLAEAINSNVSKLDVVHSGNNGLAGVPTYVCRFMQNSNNTGVDHANIQSRHAGALSGQNGVAIDFKNSSGSTTGTIVQGQSSVGYNTSSDYRLKENIVNITDGITRIKQLSPKRFNFIADTTNTLQDGFIAHEVTPVIPEAVSGVKDATHTTYYDDFDDIPEGKAIGDVKEEAAITPQSLDYAKFTPLLVAAVQELIGKVEALEAA